MRLAFVCLTAAACGRIGFDATRDGGGGDDGPGGDAGPPTGQRWVRTFPATGTSRVAGAEPDGAGGAVFVIPFQGTVQVDGAPVLAMGSGVNALAGRIAADGSTAWSHALHAGTHCDLRAADLGLDGTMLAAGFTMGPALGTTDPCDAGVGGTQDPLVLDYDPDGGFVTRATYDARVFNAQIFEVEPYPDGARAVFGVYGGDLAFNGADLPTAPVCCEATFLARVGGPPPLWQYGFASTADVRPGTIDMEPGGELCASGWFTGSATILGVPITAVGVEDAWVARLALDGTPRFVRAFGSVGSDYPQGVVATPGGGCLVEAVFSADIALGGAPGTLTSAGDSDVALIQLDATGAAIAAATIGTAGTETAVGLATTGGQAFAIVGITAPITIAGTPITPAARDAAVVALEGVNPVAVAHVITGAGDVAVLGAAGRGGDVVVYGLFTGELRSGAFTDSVIDPSGFVLALDLR